MINKYKEAVDDSKTSTSLDESFVKGYVREGKCHLCLGDYSSALRCFQRVKELEPSNKTIDVDIQSATAVKLYNESAESAYKSADYRKVIFLMDKALQHATHCSHFLLLKAECMALLGRYQEAQEIANNIASKESTNCDALFVRGMCLY